MALGKDTKIIKQGVNKIIDILEGGGSGEIAEVKSVWVCMVGDNNYEPIDPTQEQGVKMYQGNCEYQYNQNGLQVFLSTDEESPSPTFDNVAGIVEISKDGNFECKTIRNIGVTNVSRFAGKMNIFCLKRIEEGNPDAFNFIVDITLD